MALLSFKKTFDAEVAVGDLLIPIHVKRLAKEQLEELDEAWDRLYVVPRGAEIPPDPDQATYADKVRFMRSEIDRVKVWGEEVKKAQIEFSEKVMSQYVTLDEGLIEDDGKPVTSGAGLIDIFHGRRDFYNTIVSAVRDSNHLTKVMEKNSKLPQGSGTGSEVSSLDRGGEKPEQAVTPAERSTIASSEGVTAKNDSTIAGSQKSSGRSGETTGIKLH